MFVGAHLATGLIIGKITNNYPIALAGALLIDLDHVIPYVKSNVMFHPNKLWKVITGPSDLVANQRNYFHSFFTWFFVSIVLLLINPQIGVVVLLAYLSHLFLDLLDSSNFYPLYPLRYNIIGPIKYFSMHEFIFTLILFATFLVL